MGNHGVDFGTTLDQAANDLGQAGFAFDPQSQHLALQPDLLRDMVKLLQRGRSYPRHLDLDFGLTGLPCPHLVSGDDIALPDEGDAVTALLDFSQKMRVEEDGSAPLTLFTDEIADQFASRGIES